MNTLWLNDLIDERAIEDIVSTATAALAEAPKGERKELLKKFSAQICQAIRQDLRTRIRTRMIQEMNDSLSRVKRAADIAIEKEKEEVV